MHAVSSSAARTGAFIAVAPALFWIQLDYLVTYLVTLGGVALVGAAAAITAMTPERTPEAAYDAILPSGGAVIPAASVVVAVRHRLVLPGQVPPLGSHAHHGGDPP